MPAITDNPYLLQPADPSITIWRYMSLAKYVAMLRSRSLHFSRLDTFSDKFEGSLSKSHYDYISRTTRNKDEFDLFIEYYRKAPKLNYANCWHMNRSESEAMWKIYGPGDVIAIRSSYETLRDELPSRINARSHLGVFFGIVKYIDHETEDIPRDNGFAPITHKRASFSFEQECRALIWNAGNSNNPDLPTDEEISQYKMSFELPLALENIIHEVVVSPTTPAWFLDNVIDLTSKYDYKFSIKPSKLLQNPYL